MTTMVFSSKDANSLESLVEHGKKVEQERILKLIYEKDDFLENDSLKMLIKEIENE